MRRSTVLLGGLVWLAIVVAVSAITWFVIDAAGRDVLTSGQASTLPTAGGAASQDTPSGTPGGDRTSSPGPSSPRSTATRDATAPAIPGTVQVRAWQGAAGTVVARCTGSSVTLQSATPTDGWGIEVKERGPREIEVEFEQNGESEGRTRVEGGCAGGVPRFVVDASFDDDDSGGDSGGDDGDNSGSGGSGDNSGAAAAAVGVAAGAAAAGVGAAAAGVVAAMADGDAPSTCRPR